MATRLYKGGNKGRLNRRRTIYGFLNELVVNPRKHLSSKIIQKAENCPEDAKKLIAVNLANRVYNVYRGYIKYGKMNLRIHTKDNGIVIVIKHEW